MAKKANTYMIRKGITVVREGKRVRPEVGKDFELTAEEVEDIKAADAAAIGPASGEDGKADTASVETAPPTGTGTSTAPSSAEGAQAGAKDGVKTPTANVSDAEAAAGKTADDVKDDDL